MKKILKVVLPLIIIGLLFSVNMAQGAFYVTVGDAYDFEVISCNQDITAGTNTGGFTGYDIDGTVFAEGTSVNANVTNVGPAVEYNLTAGSAFDISESSNLGLSLLTAIYPLILIGYIYQYCELDDWVQADADEVLEPMLIPFIESDTDWQYYIDNATTIHNSATTNSTQTMLRDAEVSDGIDDFYYEEIMTGTMDGNFTAGTGLYLLDLDVEMHFQWAYTKATGVMLGMRLAFDITGTSNLTDVSISFDNHVEQEGYDLPGYILGGGWTWPFPAFGIIAAFTALGTIAVLVVRRRK